MNLDSNMISALIGGGISLVTTLIAHRVAYKLQKLNHEAELEQKQLQYKHQDQLEREASLRKQLISDLENKRSVYSHYAYYLSKFSTTNNEHKDENFSYHSEFNQALVASELPETIEALRAMHQCIILKKHLSNKQEFLEAFAYVQDCFINEIQHSKKLIETLSTQKHQ